DMLLSRALNRGYASARARWPMEFGLLNQDALWVMDEVQLMDVGLATSAQIQAFRDHDISMQLRPCFTWWMSATLQPEWLKSVDTQDVYDSWTTDPCVIEADQQSDGLWEIPKTVSTDTVAAKDATAFANRILNEHNNLRDSEFGQITLVVCNTVERACQTYIALQKAGRTDNIELVHSRFRPSERAAWRQRFLRRAACAQGIDRIIVATQVIEAGVDISAGCLISELAPWSSLVQRFGRCARYGGSGKVLVIDRGQDEKTARPYTIDALIPAWDAIQQLKDVGLASLEAFESSLDDTSRRQLYPFEPTHLLMREEFDELFDTTPDLTGADIDISRFIRSGDERDLQVFWREIPKNQAPQAVQAGRDELCSVPFLTSQDWLCGKETKSNRKPKLRNSMRAWIWDWIDGEWITARRDMLLPGRIVCVAANCGGYSLTTGFSPQSKEKVSVIPLPTAETKTKHLNQADQQQDGEPLSFSEWKTIACHGYEVSKQVEAICTALGLPDDLISILALVAHWHDIGKSHPAFQGKILDTENEQRPDRQDLAKAPEKAWLKPPGKYRFPDGSEERPAFRHELASALSLFAVLREYNPTHPALLGPWAEVCASLGQVIPNACLADPDPECQKILDCTPEAFNLLVYLVAAHHGKVRVGLHAAPADQNYRPKEGDHNGLPIRGIRNGDCLPSIPLRPDSTALPELHLNLEPAAMGLSFETGASWRERVQSLLQRHGPTTLGYLEALFRTADINASRLKTPDPLITKEVIA
ncbi:CRISPR-associated helicase Cas3', partial [Planctomycetota bacterium]